MMNRMDYSIMVWNKQDKSRMPLLFAALPMTLSLSPCYSKTVPSPVDITTRILDEIAARESVDPWELDDRLYDVIDPDALEALLEGTDRDSKQTPVEVEFQCCGYNIAVDTTGEIALHDQDVSVSTTGSTTRGKATD